MMKVLSIGLAIASFFGGASSFAESTPYKYNIQCEIEGGGYLAASYNNPNAAIEELQVVSMRLPSEQYSRSYHGAYIFEHLWSGRTEISFDDISGNKISAFLNLDFPKLEYDATGELTVIADSESDKFGLDCHYSGIKSGQVEVSYEVDYCVFSQKPTDKLIKADLLLKAKEKCPTQQIKLIGPTTITEQHQSCWVGVGTLRATSEYRCFK